MKTTLQKSRTPSLMTSPLAAMRGGILQRKCACGGHTCGSECEQCRQGRLQPERRTLQTNLGSRNVEFMGSSGGSTLNWHGPGALILHFHLDLEIPQKTTATLGTEQHWIGASEGS
ncbi:MAG: hypothetical protein H0X34_05210 [Chthoniobacterales bacterium]|nr:hypothetical protein [Chthoniobacterales bacterium]